MKVDTTIAATLLLILGLVIVLTNGAEDCLKKGGTMDTMAYKIDAGILFTEEVVSCSEEGVAAEMESAKPAVMASLPSDGTAGDSNVAVTSTVCEEGGGRRKLQYFPVFDRAWYERKMKFLAGCFYCSDDSRGYRLLGGFGGRAEEAAECGTRLATPGEGSFAFDTAAYIDSVALSAAAPLTLSRAGGEQVTIGLPAGETELGVSDVVGISTGSATIDTVQYSLGHCPDAEKEIGAEITAIEQRVAAGMDGAIADKPCLVEAGAGAYVEATPADATVISGE